MGWYWLNLDGLSLNPAAISNALIKVKCMAKKFKLYLEWVSYAGDVPLEAVGQLLPDLEGREPRF